jgi:hypothetical protein
MVTDHVNEKEAIQLVEHEPPFLLQENKPIAHNSIRSITSLPLFCTYTIMYTIRNSFLPSLMILIQYSYIFCTYTMMSSHKPLPLNFSSSSSCILSLARLKNSSIFLPVDKYA